MPVFVSTKKQCHRRESPNIFLWSVCIRCLSSVQSLFSSLSPSQSKLMAEISKKKKWFKTEHVKKKVFSDSKVESKVILEDNFIPTISILFIKRLSKKLNEKKSSPDQNCYSYTVVKTCLELLMFTSNTVYSSRLMYPKRNYICLCTYSVYLSFCVYMWTVLQSAWCVHVLESRAAPCGFDSESQIFLWQEGLYVCVCVCV